MATPNKDVCIALLDREVQTLESSLYILGVKSRAAEVVGNEAGKEAFNKELENVIKLIDFFNKEIERVKSAQE